MYTLRCTKRVLDRFRLPPNEAEAGESETVLGDWYANLLNVGRKRWVFCVSERSLLPVVVPARSDDSPAGLPAVVAETLACLGVNENARSCEFDAMTRHSIARTRSRSVLGVMTDLAFGGGRGGAWARMRRGGSPDELTVGLFVACGVA